MAIDKFMIQFAFLLNISRLILNPVQPRVAFHIETSHLICTANQMTGFYEIQHWTEMSEFWYLFGRQTYVQSQQVMNMFKVRTKNTITTSNVILLPIMDTSSSFLAIKYLFRFCNKDNTRRCYSAFITDFEQRLVQGAEPVFYCQFFYLLSIVKRSSPNFSSFIKRVSAN